MDYNEFGKRIQRLRKEYKMTQQELADKLLVIDKTISRWECGHGFPEITTINKICETFDIPFRLLMDEKNGLSDPNVSLEELKKKYLPTKSEDKEKPVTSKRAIILGSCGLAIVVVAAITAPFLFKREETIDHHSWEIANSSSANYVFFTSFGKEETMSLELSGDLRNGTFVCEESWVEKEGNYILDCKVYGTYSIDLVENEPMISFVANECIDPNSTKKLYTCKSIGVDCYQAEVLIDDSSSVDALNDQNFFGIKFATMEAKSSTSAFGRWTKYKNYYSRSEGEILFERVHDQLTTSQLAHSPNVMLEDMNVSVPTQLAVFANPTKTVYFEGETFDKTGMNIAIIHNDGSTYDVTTSVVVLDEDAPLTVKDTKKKISYTVDDLTLEAYIFIRVFTQD